MSLFATILTACVLALHAYFLVLECFLWERAKAVFRINSQSPDADRLRSMLKNMGTYNGFLAAGLLWSLLHPDDEVGRQLALFFLACVTIAGVVGAMTASKRIFLIQSAPALLALGAWLLA